MVIGMSIFQKYFAKYSDSFTILGGAACDEWFSQASLGFRATKDIDVVLILEAKNIALTHADVSNPTMLHIEFDLDDGVMVYDVEFYSDNVEYDYEINAVTGTILEYNKGFESEYGDNTVNSGGNSYISKEKAKQIAIDHAGVNPTYVEVEFDYENGIAVYEIEFKYQNYEYDYEIDAITGEIYKSKKEYD